MDILADFRLFELAVTIIIRAAISIAVFVIVLSVYDRRKELRIDALLRKRGWKKTNHGLYKHKILNSLYSRESALSKTDLTIEDALQRSPTERIPCIIRLTPSGYIIFTDREMPMHIASRTQNGVLLPY